MYFEVGCLCPLVSICLTDNRQACRILFFQQVPVSLRIGSGIRSCRLTVCLSTFNYLKEKSSQQTDEKMKHFDISMDKGALTNVDIIPPPSFSHGDIPFTYLYAYKRQQVIYI